MPDYYAAFVDGNGVTVRPSDEVQYRFGARHGQLVEVFSDGDAYVRFYDNDRHLELVKWKHLCGVPEQFRSGRTPSVPDTEG